MHKKNIYFMKNMAKVPIAFRKVGAIIGIGLNIIVYRI